MHGQGGEQSGRKAKYSSLILQNKNHGVTFQMLPRSVKDSIMKSMEYRGH